MRLPHRLQGQKVKSQGGAGAYCGGDLAAQLVTETWFTEIWCLCRTLAQLDVLQNATEHTILRQKCQHFLEREKFSLNMPPVLQARHRILATTSESNGPVRKMCWDRQSDLLAFDTSLFNLTNLGNLSRELPCPCNWQQVQRKKALSMILQSSPLLSNKCMYVCMNLHCRGSTNNNKQRGRRVRPTRYAPARL